MRFHPPPIGYVARRTAEGETEREIIVDQEPLDDIAEVRFRHCLSPGVLRCTYYLVREIWRTSKYPVTTYCLAQ